jgi:dTDP-4-dehydrorhamnose reductase
MKILVTGANGYIGSKVVKNLCDRNIEVIAADIDSAHVDSRAKFVKSNVFERKDNWMEVFNYPDVCLHLVWRDGFIHDSDKHMEDLSSHYDFLKNLIDNGLKKVVSMGSMHEVGYWEGVIDENTPCKPLSQYGVAKNALRQSLELYAIKNGCLFQWLRGFYIYGDDSFGNSIFCKIRKAVENGQTEFPFTSGKNKYDFIHIDTLAEMISDCVIQNSVLGIINCCSGKPVSLGEQIEWYISQNNLPIKLAYGKYPDRPYDSPCIYGDINKLNQVKEVLKARVFVTGVCGQLGYDVINELNRRGIFAIGSDIKNEDEIIDKANWNEYVSLNIVDPVMVKKVLDKYKPTAIIHCAAWTNVDGAEDKNNQPIVKAINVDGTNNLVSWAKSQDAKFLYISTDYVFNGQGNKPWDPDDKAFEPLNYYGQTKLDGENIVSSLLQKYFIVRIAWAFGKNGNNFIKTMYKASQKYDIVRVINDQIGTPTYTYDLARLVVDMILSDKYGYYHATNEGGFISWYDLTCEIYKIAGIDTKVIPVTTSEYGKSVAKRPFNSRLNKNKLLDNGFEPLPDWRDAVKRYLDIIKNS